MKNILPKRQTDVMTEGRPFQSRGKITKLIIFIGVTNMEYLFILKTSTVCVYLVNSVHFDFML